ncbi:MAG: hypothetical protein JSS46_07765 [Proteobacteria bacterium]|jgi:hypothetical protein|nr:hypothetical protein [Pseudomonadota bacterium]
MIILDTTSIAMAETPHAIAHSVTATVATRNAPDFDACGISVIDPWEA